MFEKIKQAAMPLCDEAWVSFSEEGSFYSEFDFEEETDPQDVYSKWFHVSFCVEGENGDAVQVVQVGDIHFCAHYLEDLMIETDYLPVWLIDDDSADQGLCASLIDEMDGELFDNACTVAYLAHICVKEEFCSMGIEEEIIASFDKIFRMATRRNLDLVFGLAVEKEKKWVLAAADHTIFSQDSEMIWLKRF